MGFQIKLFSGSSIYDVQSAVNEFIKTVAVHDIKFSTCEQSIDVMVIYHAK